MAKQTFTTGQVLTAAQMTSLQQTAMGGGSATAKTASYTLVAADAGTTVIMNSASATTVTVNTSLFSAGDTVYISNIGAGVSTITAGTATVNTSASLALAQYEGGTLYFTSASAALFFKSAGAAAGGGKILQVVQATYATSTTSSSTSYADTGLSASITPSAASSRILVMVNQPSLKDVGNASNGVNLRIMRGATVILTQTYTLYTATNLALFGIVSFNFVDSPSTTSALTYKTQFANTNASAQVEVQHNSNTSILTLMEIGA